MPRLKLYCFISDEGKAFSFDNVGDFDFRVVMPIIGKNGRKILPSLLRQDIAIVATVLFGNSDIFNRGFHSNRSGLTKCFYKKRYCGVTNNKQLIDVGFRTVNNALIDSKVPKKWIIWV